MKLTEQQGYILLGASPALALGLGIGLATGLFVAKKRIESKYLAISSKEIAEAKEFYSVLHKKGDFATPESAVEILGLSDDVEAIQKFQGDVADATEAIRRYQGEDEQPEHHVEIQSVSIDAVATPHNGPIEVVKHNIFTDAEVDVVEDDFDYKEELKHRGEVEPYIISHDEFMEGESENTQVTLTYYEGDEVLTDEKDQPIPDVDETVGEDNIQRFGYGSKDPKIVYIRNPRLDIDFEVVQSQGKYTEEVLGFIQHSDNRIKIRRFRGDDE